MKAKKIIIAVAAVVLVFSAVIATQFIGRKDDTDAKTSVIDTNKPVVIDVSVSDSDVEPKAELTWTELGKLTTYEKMRTAVDTAFDSPKRFWNILCRCLGYRIL